jgi:hypothetical protein
MKKLLVLLGLATAAAYGLMKLVRGGDEDEFDIAPHAAQPRPRT